MLLQIIDPTVHETEISQRKKAIGIDLGTTNSVASVLNDEGVPEIIRIDDRLTMPSVVAFNKDQPIVGYEAMADVQAIHSAKRFMNRPMDEIAFGKSAVEISSLILAKLRQAASAYLEDDIVDAVITVPAYFDDTQRQATKDAARIAGLNVLRLLNEPTAAAVAYGLDTRDEGTYLVYDLGGGTFDVSILKLRQGVFRVLATGGDTSLGGDDIDASIAQFLKLAPTTENLQKSRLLKEQLANRNVVSSAQQELTQNDLQALLHPFLERTLMICDQAIKDAQITLDEIDAILLVGGATRTYGLKQALETYFNLAVKDDVDPDLIVSFGAAVQAHALTQGAEHVLMDVTPLSLGIETIGGVFEKIIYKNTPIPVAKAQEFTTYQDGQTALKVHVLQGEREMVADCRSLGQFTLKGIPPMPAGLARVQIIFRLDADGLLTVEALEKHTQVQQTIEIKPTYGLDEDTLIKMIYAAHENAKEDMEQRLLTQSIVQAEHLIDIIKKAIELDFALISLNELEKVRGIMQLLEGAITARVRDKIEQHYDALANASQNFAERRIEHAIKQQLVGETINKN